MLTCCDNVILVPINSTLHEAQPEFYQVYQQWHVMQKIYSLLLSAYDIMWISFQYDNY